MTVYVLALVFINAFASGHALARFHATGEWFYRLACPFFALSSASLAWLMIGR